MDHKTRHRQLLNNSISNEQTMSGAETCGSVPLAAFVGSWLTFLEFPPDAILPDDLACHAEQKRSTPAFVKSSDHRVP